MGLNGNADERWGLHSQRQLEAAKGVELAVSLLNSGS